MKYHRKSGLHEASLDGSDTILLDVETSKYFDLNPVAASIWKLMEQPRSLSELCEQLIQEYDVDSEVCEQEVEAFMALMLAKDLCELVNAR